ncbi:MAG: hypothetical protein HY270_23925 [Deltaproteobacteria bacterium]|nr:hypothetical protein [Deltaproteobacteria bacterium]
MRFSNSLALALSVTCLLAGCSDDDSRAVPTLTPTRSATLSPSRTATDTPFPSSTATRIATATPTATRTSSATATATASPSSIPSPSLTTTPDRSRIVADLAAVGLGRYLGRPVPQPSGFEGSWQRYDFAASDDGPICIHGDPFRVYVRPGTSNNVLFYLEGGGACWNNDTCWVHSRAKLTAAPIGPLDIFPGIFLRNDPTNPFTDWNMVYVPYCDGSVFSGDNIADYTGGRAWHRGVSNLSTGVDVTASLYPHPDKIVVSGSSAGGYGTFSGYGVMRLAYPNTEIRVLNDSGPGLENTAALEMNGELQTNWRLTQFFPPTCPLCFGQPIFITDWAMDRDPTLRGAMFSTLRDYVIRDFLSLTAEQYEALLLNISGRVQSQHTDRLKRFFVNNDFHTILLGLGITPDGHPGPLYRNLRIGDTLLSKWVYDFVNDGPAWQDLVQTPAQP